MTYDYPMAGARGPDPSAPRSKAKNWLGITALITSFVCCLQVLGLIFGILGLRAAKRGEATNRGMSLFAVWWSAVWILFAIGVGVWYLMDPDARDRDFIGNFGAAGADVAAVDEAIHDIEDNGRTVTAIGWDGENYYVGDIVVPAESDNPVIDFYVNSDGHCLQIKNTSTGGAVSTSSNASLAHGTSCTGTPEPLLTP